MPSRWNSPGSIRALSQFVSSSVATPMDTLQGLDEKLLSALSLIRPVKEVPLATVPP